MKKKETNEYKNYLVDKSKRPKKGIFLYVDKDCKKSIDLILAKENWTMRHLITGLLNKFIDDYSKVK